MGKKSKSTHSIYVNSQGLSLTVVLQCKVLSTQIPLLTSDEVALYLREREDKSGRLKEKKPN